MKHNPVTDLDRQRWAATGLIARAEFRGFVYELNDSGKVYVLERSTPAPRRIGDRGGLDLVGVIPNLTDAFRLKIHRLADN
jgi:hypothetical protein